MRRATREIPGRARIEAILAENTLLHLAMSDGGEPYVLPLSYGWKDGAIWLHCAPEGRKLDVLRADPRVAFSVVASIETVRQGRPCAWTTYYASVVGTGRARIFEDGPEFHEGLAVLVERFGGDPAELPAQPRGVAVIRIEIESLTGKANEAHT